VKREPIFNLPAVVAGLIGILVAVQILVDLFPKSFGVWSLTYLSFIPARLTFLVAPTRTLRELSDVDGDALAAFLETARYSWATPLSYALLHANWTHLGVNIVTLAAFGTPVAQRLGGVRFLLFCAATAIAGAVAHFATHPFDIEPVVGASAAISGAMAGIARFAFARGAALGESDDGEAREEDASRPQTLARVFSNPRAALFLASWLLANLLFGLFAPAPGGVGVIAWQAHIGGFVAGLLLFGWFDPAKPPLRRGG
jgi:membrane associated rhomboid family serine protease